jgi:hypothetical protein
VVIFLCSSGGAKCLLVFALARVESQGLTTSLLQVPPPGLVGICIALGDIYIALGGICILLVGIYFALVGICFVLGSTRSLTSAVATESTLVLFGTIFVFRDHLLRQSRGAKKVVMRAVPP